MAEPLVDQVLRKIGEARELYHRLILMVGPAGSGKTSALQGVSASTSAPLINVNLELSRRMLDLTERQRTLQLPRLLGEIVGEEEELRFLGFLVAAECDERMLKELLKDLEKPYSYNIKLMYYAKPIPSDVASRELVLEWVEEKIAEEDIEELSELNRAIVKGIVTLKQDLEEPGKEEL